MLKNERINEYTKKIEELIKSAEKDGIRIKPYETTINDISVEMGFAITDEVEFSYVPTWKLAE